MHVCKEFEHIVELLYRKDITKLRIHYIMVAFLAWVPIEYVKYGHLHVHSETKYMNWLQ